FEYLQAAKERLKVVIPFTLLIIFMLIYISTRSVIKTAIVLLAVPFSLIGAFWLLYLLGYNMSVAVWVGLIALAGLDAETGVVMLLYLDHAWEKRGLKEQEEEETPFVPPALMPSEKVRRRLPRGIATVVIAAAFVYGANFAWHKLAARNVTGTAFATQTVNDLSVKLSSSNGQ